ncbi:Uncharacterized protein DAT39_022873, partial [Clarias magur]
GLHPDGREAEEEAVHLQSSSSVSSACDPRSSSLVSLVQTRSRLLHTTPVHHQSHHAPATATLDQQ